MFKMLGLILVLVSWLSGLYLVKKWRGTNAMSISQHAASAKEASSLFVVILVLGGGAFYAWLIIWFVPKLSLPAIFTILLTVTVLAQIIAALIPDTDAWKRKLHRRAAYTMAVLYFPLSFLILSSNTISRIARLIGGLCLAYMVVSFVMFVILRKSRDKYLIYQSLYIVAFQLVILSAAYL